MEGWAAMLRKIPVMDSLRGEGMKNSPEPRREGGRGVRFLITELVL